MRAKCPFFLKTYIEKTLNDSGIYNAFENFFNRQTKDTYQAVKKTFLTLQLSIQK